MAVLPHGFDLLHSWPRMTNAKAPREEPVQPVSVETADFDAFVDALISLVPKADAPAAGSTWIERGVRKFDMKSVF